MNDRLMKIIEMLGAFCLGFSLTRIYGLSNGVILAVGIICFIGINSSMKMNPGKIEK